MPGIVRFNGPFTIAPGQTLIATTSFSPGPNQGPVHTLADPNSGQAVPAILITFDYSKNRMPRHLAVRAAPARTRPSINARSAARVRRPSLSALSTFCRSEKRYPAMKVTVITGSGGKIVGTMQHSQQSDGPTVTLIPGKGQKAVELDIPSNEAKFTSAEEFHQTLKRHFKK